MSGGFGMIGYKKDEIIPATKIARNLSTILNKLKKRQLKKVAILRNNELESVIIPLEEYETLMEVYELAEHREIYALVKEREETAIEEAIPLETVLRENKIDENEL